ncbi:hypothetical protein B0H13DRAFT_2300198 [Mycena leptocephala]|nr:hypothetical protein B0H13DRAFT_2300198 [Mycena leptocephala]
MLMPSPHFQTRIYTVDSSNSQVDCDCVVVNNSYRDILRTGALSDVNLIPDLPIRFIPRNAIVVPGLSGTSFFHFYGGVLALEGTATIQETVARMREYILANPSILHNPDVFIRGGGWDHTSWPGAVWPTAADLDGDDVIRGRPVVLHSKDCHAQWVSGKALELSAPLPGTVEGGVILIDEVDKPNAQELLKMPALTEAEVMERFMTAVNDALVSGLTCVHDAGLDPGSLRFFMRQSHIPIHIYGMKFFDETEPYWGNITNPSSAPPTGASLRAA